MADEPNDNNNEIEPQEPSSEEALPVPLIPLSVASRTGFNERAWNDPPPLLMAGQGSSIKTHVDTPRPKLIARVAYPLAGSSTNYSPPGKTLDPSGPPPTTGFIAKAHPPPSCPPTSGSVPMGSSPPSSGLPPTSKQPPSPPS